MLDDIGGFGQSVAVAGSSAAHPAFRSDLADATRRACTAAGDDAGDSARGAALIAALAWTEAGRRTPSRPPGPVAEPDETRARAWDELWAHHESTRYRLHPHLTHPGDPH